ncbi:prolipoprotein diacylglyceryl transferase [Mycetocola reblochoni]|uniref:Phosphatidylglycerol--prolipoprotein diacylglyceryl transferase n=2 Tax=Mycetocola reblochoni TaxID=331618 RepID=A0A1R4J5F8_9MICO|nr:prolipoprotein diacylglyceryl transferase [Mycetocola reblochoni]RLP69710.1 prolipoprotein diacylglyceryl transferase [Mycetocola reblochoni]SJN26933.1 Prolipoprotein diacylglyceryl transferase [Mycetocola reblochoni REB411]
MSFPLSIPSPSVNHFSIGPFPLYFYALCILAGIIAAALLTDRRLTARGGERGVVLDFVLWTVPLGIIGARAFHVLTHLGDYIGQPFWAVFDLRAGGIAIFGALIGGAVGAIIASRMTGIRFWAFADALAPGLLLAQAFGRLGNWFNHELFGQPTTLPWGLEIESSNPAYPIGLPEGVLFHPTFLYEIIWNLIGVAAIIAVGSRLRLQWGRTFALYLIWYGAGRVVWETIRIDPSIVVLGLRINVWMALGAVVLGIVILIVQGRRHPGLETSPYRAGRGPAADEADDDVDGFVDVSAPEAGSATDAPGAEHPVTAPAHPTR